MFIEFAEDRPRSRTDSKICLTPDWASSKLPSTAQTWTLRPSCVTICAFWTGLTPSTGIEHGDIDTGNIPETLKGSFAGIAAGGGEDGDLLSIAALFRRSLHQIRQQAEGDVLESGGGTAEQLKHGHIADCNSRGQFPSRGTCRYRHGGQDRAFPQM